MKVRPQIGRIVSEADAQVVAGMWMISCLDDNPGLMYHSVASRLNTEEGKVKKVVEDWRELFRLGINHEDPNHERLDTLKSLILELEKMKGLTPEQYKDLENKLDSADNLKDWCFRSRFRRSLSAPRSAPDEIRVGLDYVETHRKTYLEFAEKERQQRVYRAPLWTIWVTLFLGLLALGSNVYIGRLNVDAATKANNLKERELDLKASELASKQQEIAKPSSAAPSSLHAR